ncbi:hypothetical protein N5P37_004664, partial [Trichoderma harzianum]
SLGHGTSSVPEQAGRPPVRAMNRPVIACSEFNVFRCSVPSTCIFIDSTVILSCLWSLIQLNSSSSSSISTALLCSATDFQPPNHPHTPPRHGSGEQSAHGIGESRSSPLQPRASIMYMYKAIITKNKQTLQPFSLSSFTNQLNSIQIPPPSKLNQLTRLNSNPPDADSQKKNKNPTQNGSPDTRCVWNPPPSQACQANQLPAKEINQKKNLLAKIASRTRGRTVFSILKYELRALVTFFSLLNLALGALCILQGGTKVVSYCRLRQKYPDRQRQKNIKSI